MKISRRTVLIGGGALVAAGGAYGAVRLSGSGGDVVERGVSRARAVRSDALPATADVVIIGGGIVGAACAYYLARQGLAVVVCEKGAVAGEASGRAMGAVSGAGVGAIKLPLVHESKRLWAEFNATAGIDTGYRNYGEILPFRDEPTEAFWRGWLAEVGAGADGARMLSGGEADRLLPGVRPWRGAFLDASSGAAEPTLAAPAFAEAAQRLGAKIVQSCAVRTCETEAGHVSHVVTERGSVRTKTVVLAGGAWSSLYAGNQGLQLPSLSIFTTMLRVTADAPAGRPNPTIIFEVPGAGARPSLDGSYVVGATKGRIAISPDLFRNAWRFRDMILSPPWDVRPHFGRYFWSQLAESRHWRADEQTPFERNRILQPTVNQDVVAQLRAALPAEFPAFATMKIVEQWTGAITVTQDNMPVIGAIDAPRGLLIATGFSYGITMGPAAGKAVADLIAGTPTAFDLKPYRFERFADGSDLTMVP